MKSRAGFSFWWRVLAFIGSSILTTAKRSLQLKLRNRFVVLQLSNKIEKKGKRETYWFGYTVIPTMVFVLCAHKPAVGRHVRHFHFRANRHRLVVVLSVCHSLRWAERRNVTNVDRTPTWLGNVANVGSHPGIANSDYMICPTQRYRLRHRCKVLQGISLINFIFLIWFLRLSSLSLSPSPPLFAFDFEFLRFERFAQYLRCFWHPSTFSGQSQLWAFSLYSKPPMHNCSVAVPFQQVQ